MSSSVFVRQYILYEGSNDLRTFLDRQLGILFLLVCSPAKLRTICRICCLICFFWNINCIERWISPSFSLKTTAVLEIFPSGLVSNVSWSLYLIPVADLGVLRSRLLFFVGDASLFLLCSRTLLKCPALLEILIPPHVECDFWQVHRRLSHTWNRD